MAEDIRKKKGGRIRVGRARGALIRAVFLFKALINVIINERSNQQTRLKAIASNRLVK